MPLSGTLRTWHDDRGFGFIAPRDGGRELFVHISAFPRDGSRPTIGETLHYELGTGKDGKPQAIKVYRVALGRPAQYPKADGRRAQRRSPVAAVVALLVVGVMAAGGYSAYGPREGRPHALPVHTTPAPAVTPVTTAAPREPAASFRCDGRTYCSQMTSCAEAKFFLAHCPGTKMDGNHDGVPCEQQWCTGAPWK